MNSGNNPTLEDLISFLRDKMSTNDFVKAGEGDGTCAPHRLDALNREARQV